MMTMDTPIDYENPWYYKGSAFTSDDINDLFGFVYRITNLSTGKQYIGRKYFWQKRKPKGGKRRVTSESDWKRYFGSSEELKRDIKDLGRENLKRNPLSPQDPRTSQLRRDPTTLPQQRAHRVSRWLAKIL